MNWSPRFVFWLLAALGVAIFAFGPALLQWVSPVTSDNLSDLALLGDSYGAINALFSGGALLVLALVFLHDRRVREDDLERERHSKSPFVVPNIAIEESAIQITRAEFHQSHRLEMLIDNWELRTTTNSVAINVAVTTSVHDANQKLGIETRRVARPISEGSPYNGQPIVIHLSGDNARTAIERLCQPVPDVALELRVRADYSGVDKESWFTSYSVDLKVKSQGDRGKLQDVVDGAAAFGGPGLRIPLEATLKEGSWDQGD